MSASTSGKFQRLLRELFQFDCADLDFGIYRVMNYKRGVIETFITDDLPRTIADELRRGPLADQAQAAEDLQEVAQRVRDDLGENALDADGNLAVTFRDTPLGRKYLRAKRTGGLSREALEATIYNHLHAFFSRYYQDGDFISKRRYSRRQRYAIPYNGEEVYLYWANHDQYYVKSDEHFRNYAFTRQGITVHFAVQAAHVEQNDVKGDKRFFLPLVEEITCDAEAGRVLIPFHYRPLTGRDELVYGRRNQQEAIIRAALTEIPRRLRGADAALAMLTAERHRNGNGNGDGRPVNFLEYHLRRYTRRNTSDFFIHKNLRGFLTQELDFYLKNEVLDLDEITTAGEEVGEGWFQLMQTIKAVGGRIIEFLDQIESFQKMLWEKRKFITETWYCITVGAIDRSFYPDIAACDPQWAEWKEMFHIDEDEDNLFTCNGNRTDRRLTFLETHPTLVLDTRHFDGRLADKLLAAFDDITQATDGVLVHGDNFHALTLLTETYRRKIKCVYIDPPYNSKTTEILYKNTYKHSSWLAMMDCRLALSRQLSTIDGSHVVAIDENEQEVLGSLLGRHFPNHARVCVSIVHNKKGIQGSYFSYNHELAYFCIPYTLPEIHAKPVVEDEWSYDNLRKWGRESERHTARNCFYPIIVEGNQIVGFGDVCAESFHPGGSNVTDEGRIFVYPVDARNVERKWRYARSSVEGIAHLLTVHVTSSGEVQIHKANSERSFKTVWDDPKYVAGDYGTRWLTDLGLKMREDLYPKSIHTVEDSIYAVSDADSVVLDYFAGSGTTGHAVIKLNRDEAASKRRFVLAEMGEYFDTVTLPRIKKVMFTPEWKEGRPVRMATREEAERGPRIVKYHRLESYEDALNNIAFDDAAGQQALRFHDYVLKYLLKWETRASATLLNVEKLSRPFDYRLGVHVDGQRHARVADLPETFNYLLGLRVRTRRVYHDEGRRYLVYRGSIDDRTAVVIWRETEGWRKEELIRDKEFVTGQDLTAAADEVFVNGDSFIPNAKALEPVFKARMFAPLGS